MNIVLNKRLQNIPFLFVIASLMFFSSSCFAQTESNKAETNTKSSTTNIVPDCNSANPQSFPGWQGNDLHKAVLELDAKAVKKLLKQNFNINEKDSYGNTPLISALTQRIPEPKPQPREVVLRNRQREGKAQLEIAQMLLQQDADVNIKGLDGKTALIKTVTLDESVVLNLLSLLIQNKADVNLQDNQGFTALMEAARTDRLKVVSFLLKNGADTNLKNCKAMTALSIAQEYKFAAVIQALSRNE